MVSGVLADDILVYPEVRLLLHWLENHSHILDQYPYDRLFSMINGIEGEMDGVGISKLKTELYLFLGREVKEDSDTEKFPMDKDICELKTNGRYCLVGSFQVTSKEDVISKIESANGIVNDHIRLDTNYLVVGAVNQDWKNSSDAEVIEQAIAYQEMDSGIIFLNEVRFLELWNNE